VRVLRDGTSVSTPAQGSDTHDHDHS
jgi:hypothetical protein